MVSTTISATQSAQVADRAALRAGLEATRTAFHALIDSVSADRWIEKSPRSDWTVGEVLVHLTWALEYLPKEVSLARRGKGMFNAPKWLADPVSYRYVRLLARKSTPDSVRRRYDAAITAAIKLLDTIPDSDWTRGANFYGEGFHTVEDLFRAPAQHLVEHTVGL